MHLISMNRSLLHVVVLLTLAGLSGCETRFQAQQRQREKVAKDLKKMGETLHNQQAHAKQPQKEDGDVQNEQPIAPAESP